MKKLLGISLVAVLAVSPLMASAAGKSPTAAATTDDPFVGVAINDSVDAVTTASAKYVKGAYNAAIGAINEVQANTTSALADKQDTLTEAQLAAANSGITAAKVSTYDGYAEGKQNTLSATNQLNTAYVATNDNAQFVTAAQKTEWSGKQDELSEAQLAAANSGITAAKVSTYDGYAEGKQDTLSATNQLNTAYVATNDNAQFVTATEKSTWSAKQDALDAAGLAAVGSGITQAKREGYDNLVTASANYATKEGVAATVNKATGSVTVSGTTLAVAGEVTGKIPVMAGWGDTSATTIDLADGAIKSGAAATGTISGIDVSVTGYYADANANTQPQTTF